MADNKGVALGWDDEGKVQEGGDYDVLPAGEYSYEVTDFKRERYDGGKNMGPCPVAVLQLKCINEQASGTVFTRLYLNSKVMFRISNFFKSAGLIPANAPEGSSMPMSLFERAVGCIGQCKVKVRKYEYQGEKRESNDVDFIVPKVTAQPQAQPAPQQYTAQPQPQYQQPQYQPQPQQYQPMPQTGSMF